MADAPPRDRDEIDPELVALRRPRAGVGPLLAASVVGLSLYVMWELHSDLSFWSGAKTPRDVGAQVASLPPNGYVTVTAVADRARAVRLRGRADVGRRVAPVQGTSGTLWLDVEGDAVLAKAAWDEKITGRVRDLDDLSYSDELRDFVEHQPAAPRFVSLADLAPAGGEMADLAGDRIALAADTRVELEERVANVARVTVVKTDTLKDEAAARLALSAALGQAAPAPVASPEGSWVYEVPADPTALRARFTAARFYAGIVEPRYVLHLGTRADVTVGATGVSLAGQPEIPFAAIEHAAVYVPTRIPADARMLIAGETPDEYWYVPVLFALLGVLSALVIWAFVRTLRPEKGSGAAAPV